MKTKISIIVLLFQSMSYWCAESPNSLTQFQKPQLTIEIDDQSPETGSPLPELSTRTLSRAVSDLGRQVAVLHMTVHNEVRSAQSVKGQVASQAEEPRIIRKASATSFKEF